MPLVALKPKAGLSLGNSALICSDTGLPRVAAGIWCSLNQLRYSDKYLRSYLRAFERFYVHCSHVQTENPVDLDYLLASGKIDLVISKFTTFIAELQNQSIRTGVDQSETCRMVCSILGDVLNEFAQRKPDYKVSNSELTRKLANLETLYKYLKPSRLGKSFTKRSLPPDIIEEMFSLFDPVSNESIFRSESIRYRNFIAFSILYFMGLRRGELLNLTTDCVQTGFDPISNKNIFWLNVRKANILDERTHPPSLKNRFSFRQIPLPEFLYQSILNYVVNYRGRCPHGFLLPSQKGRPLSDRSMNDIFERVTFNLSLRSKRDIQRKCSKTSVSLHDLRHTAAVNRIRSYRHSGIPQDQAESMMQAFFGWSASSRMPQHYASAFYEEQLNGPWLDKFSSHVDRISKYGKQP